MKDDRSSARGAMDRRSVLVGVALGLLPLALVGAQQRQGAAGDDSPKFPRYQVAAWSDGTGDRHGAFVVNTETGELVAVIGRSFARGNQIAAEHTVQKVAR